MTIYTVHLPPASRLRGGADPMRARLVKEGFCWPAFVLALPWLVVRGMWITAAFYVLALAAAIYVGQQAELLPVAIGIAAFVTLLLGFEGNDLRRWSLGLRSYEFAGVVEAASRAEAEIRYFSIRREPPPVPVVTPLPPDRTALPPPTDVVGMFPGPSAAS